MADDAKALRKALVAQGWSVEQTKNGHYRAIPPDPDMDIVIMAGTPSDRRALQNDIARLRRNGFIWKGRA